MPDESPTERYGSRRSKDDGDDSVLAGFLSFLEGQMIEHPELIEPADLRQLERIRQLV